MILIPALSHYCSALVTRARRQVPSPLVGEGQDEGETGMRLHYLC
jgi:hypothetical protein